MPYSYNVLRSAVWPRSRVRQEADRSSRRLMLAILFVQPVGGSGSIINMLVPTLGDPLVDLYNNRDFADRPIMPDEKEFGPKVPDAQRYWGSVSPVAKAITDTITTLTGGDKVRPGAIDLSPETLEYLFGVVTGASGQFFRRVADLPLKAMDPNADIEINDIPFVRKFVGDKPAWVDKANFYERQGEIEQQKDYIKRYQKEGNAEGAKAVIEEHKKILALDSLGKASREGLAVIRKERTRLDKDKSAPGYADKIKALKEREDVLVDRFNAAWIKAQAQ